MAPILNLSTLFCVLGLFQQLGSTHSVRRMSDYDSFSNNLYKQEDLGFDQEPSLRGPEIYDVNGKLAATLKYAVWLDDEFEYRSYQVEMHGGRTANKYDEVELYHIEQVGESRWETTFFRMHQNWKDIQLLAVCTMVNTDGEVPFGELKHGADWNPSAFYNGDRLYDERWDVTKGEYLKDGSKFGHRKYVIDPKYSLSTVANKCTSKVSEESNLLVSIKLSVFLVIGSGQLRHSRLACDAQTRAYPRRKT